MVKRSKIIYIVGSLLIGVVSLLAVLFALIAGGGVGGAQTKLVFESESAEKVYDGTPLTCVKWKLTSGELKKGYEIKATVTGTQTDAGTGENSFSAPLTDKNGKDKTDSRTHDRQLQARIPSPNSDTFSLSPFRFHGFRG